MLGFLRQILYKCPQHLKERSYKAIVHPKLEYCFSIWDPHHQKYINKLEMTQCRAARFVKNVPYWHDKPFTSDSVLVNDLAWESLWLDHRLSMLCRITNGLVELPPEYHPTPCCHSTCGHSRQFPHFRTEVDSFRTILAWKALPCDVTEAVLRIYSNNSWANLISSDLNIWRVVM